VAVADTELDSLATDEAALIRRGLPYLHRVWRNRHWRLYRVEHSTGLVSRRGHGSSGAGNAHLTALGPASFTLFAPHAGRFVVRVRYTGYWTVTSGRACVERQGDWTKVRVRRPGTVNVAARFSLDGLVGRDGECSG
jgi:hypothetical protein